MTPQPTSLPAPAGPSALAAPPRPYDVEMIEDFLHQLLWELRIDHGDWADASDRGHPTHRGDAHLLPFIERHGSLLLPAVVLKGQNHLTHQQEQLLRSRIGAMRQRQIDALEVLLEGLIPDVLRSARQSAEGGSTATPVTEVDARSLLGSNSSVDETAGS